MEIVQLNSSNVLMAIDTLLLPGAQFEEFEEFEEVGALYDRRGEWINLIQCVSCTNPNRRLIDPSPLTRRNFEHYERPG